MLLSPSPMYPPVYLIFQKFPLKYCVLIQFLFFQVFWSRMNVVKVLRACEKALLWNETVYLYKVSTVHTDNSVRAQFPRNEMMLSI